MPRIRYVSITALGLLLAYPVGLRAQSHSPALSATVDTVATVSDSLRVRIADLEGRLARLEETIGRQQEEARQQSLRERAQQRAAGGEEAEADPRSVKFYGSQRQINQLNPEISMTGDFIGCIRSPKTPAASVVMNPDWTGMDYTDNIGFLPTGNSFYLRAAELNVVAPLDPFTRGKFFFEVPGDGHLAVDEAYMQWVSAANLKVGYFRNQFGQLNRWHEHGLPQMDRPQVLTTFFNQDGLEGLGASVSYVLGRLWSDVNEITAEYVSGGDGVSFTQAGTRDHVVVARLKNYYDLSTDTYFEVGLSGAHGYNDAAGDYATTIGGVDLNYRWLPASRSHYRSLEIRAEALLSKRETPTGTVTAWGAYLSAQQRFGARLLGSVRLDYTQLPWDASETMKGIAATLDFWQSEFVFFRLQVDYTTMTFADDMSRVILQTVWSMGPHKHEAY